MKQSALVKGILALCCTISATGCATQPEKTLNTSNRGYKLDQLFTDPSGYKVYRFLDQGEYRYYVTSPTGSAQMLPSSNLQRTQNLSLEADSNAPAPAMNK